jgi:thioredoxin 1
MATLSVERVICSSSSSSHGAMATTTTTMPRVMSMAMACPRNRNCRAKLVLAESTRWGGRAAAARAVVCRSSVRPLSDSNGNVVEFQTEEEFDSILTEAGDKLVVVDISTTTCGPCKMIFPKLVEMSLAYPDAVFLKINGDVNNDTRTLMRKWGVRAVPSFRFFRNGQQVHAHTGAKLEELKTRFAEHYGSPIKV